MTAPSIAISDQPNANAAAISKSASRFIPLRQAADQPDEHDPKRLSFLRSGWAMFDDLLRAQNRQIEENVRMLSGQQTAVYHPATGRWIDIADWMTDDERRWRARPSINLLQPWSIITHARMTENQPIVTFVPGPDRADAELAELLDIAVKTAWFEANMEDIHDRLMAWVLAAGRGHIISRINPNKGQLRKWVGEGMVPMVDANDQPVSDQDGGQGQQQVPDGVPYDRQGNPLAKWRVQDPENPTMGGELVPTGPPHSETIGAIEADVLAPMQVRGSWGPQPWHEKRVHYIKSYHAPEEVYDMFGIEVEPTIRGGVSDVGELERLLYGTGFFGSVDGTRDAQLSGTNVDGYVELLQRWEAPCNYPGMERTHENPGGRWTVITPNEVLRDGPRIAPFPYTSTLNTFDFVRQAGRNGGSTPLENLNPIQRAINDDFGRVRDHVNLSSNPQTVIDGMSGMKPGQRSNRPGANYVLTRRPGVPAIEHVQPPRLGDDVYKHIEMMLSVFDRVGFSAGINDPGTPGDSGEKVKEVRFNTDRFLGPTMRRAAGEYGRLYDTWRCLFPLIWDMETTIHYAGDDNIARTVVVYPELWKEGQCNVRADAESMLPEGRGEKQEKAFEMYSQGMFGEIGSPTALRKFWEVARMPHLSRFAKPGGIHTTTAEQENGKLVLGTPAEEIAVFEWYDDEAHLAIHEHFMASPEFLKLDPAIQDAFVLHRQAHLFNASQKLAQAAMQQGALQNMVAPQGGPGGSRPAGGAPSKGNGAKNGAAPVRPAPPTPPSGPIPGSVMPTAAGASSPGLTQ